MLVEFGHEEREGQCCRCRRRSPVLRGDKDAAATQLRDFGWAMESDTGWRCPVCRDRASGQFKLTRR